MEFNDYQEKVLQFRTEKADEMYALVGLSGEVGELHSLVAKAIRDGVKDEAEFEKNVKKVSSEDSKSTPNIAQETVVKALKHIDETTMAVVFKDGFHEYIDDVQVHLNEIGNSIHERFFRI
jgi:hypothetical protein